MTLNDFMILAEDDKKIVFDEMNELYKLINSYPISYEELKIFTEWHSATGKFNEELKDLLIGIYPYERLNNCKDIQEAKNILELSDKALKLVSFWNKIARRKVCGFE